jgi:hypothetical protein
VASSSPRLVLVLDCHFHHAWWQDVLEKSGSRQIASRNNRTLRWKEVIVKTWNHWLGGWMVLGNEHFVKRGSREDDFYIDQIGLH